MKFEITETYSLKVSDTLDKVLQSLEEYGLDIMSIPPEDEMPQLPKNVSDLPPSSLGALLSRLSAYYEYIQGVHGMFYTLAFNLKESLDTAQAAAFINATGTVEQRRNLAKIDPKVIELKEKWLSAKTRADMIEKGRLKPLSKRLSVVSRLIAVTDQESRLTPRVEKVGNTDDFSII